MADYTWETAWDPGGYKITRIVDGQYHLMSGAEVIERLRELETERKYMKQLAVYALSGKSIGEENKHG